MPLYLTRFSYTPETWARMIDNPEDRRAAAQAYIESVGGKLHGFWYAFGEHDAINLWEAPDNVSMAAVVLAISGRRRAELARDDGPVDRRRDDGGPAQGPAGLLPAARHVAEKRSGSARAPSRRLERELPARRRGRAGGVPEDHRDPVVIVRLSVRIRRFALDSLTASVTVPPGRTANGLRARTTRLLALLLRLTRIFRTLVNVALPVSAPLARKVNVKPPPRLTLITDFEPAKRAARAVVAWWSRRHRRRPPPPVP